jgi:drug/metabolite transporter (DMT)-like permease
LIGAFAATIAYGAATVLQAIGAREGGDAAALDRKLVSRLLHSPTYVAGLVLDAVGFGLSFAALRTLPLFTVQAIIACSLAVTALLAVGMLGAQLMIREWVALGGVTAGLSLLGLSARSQHQTKLSEVDRGLLVISVLVVGGVTYVAARHWLEHTRHDGWVLGGLAGLMYGGGGIGARILHNPSPFWTVLSDPAFYAMAISGILGLLLYAMALQRSKVTVVTAAVVVTETVVPALVGLMLLGDRPSHGGTAIAAVGFALAVGGAIALARYGEPPKPVTGPAAEAPMVRSTPTG